MAKDTNKTEQIAYRILIEPWITEEATRIAEMNKYIFKVAPGANKNEIKKAVEDVYSVKVTEVNTINIHRKRRVRGRTTGWKPGYKKAIVSVKEGDKIEFFDSK